MIKQIVVAASAALICAGANAAYKDGTYEGVGTGNASEITVQVQVKGGKVAAVKVVKHGETPMLLGAAEKKLAKFDRYFPEGAGMYVRGGSSEVLLPRESSVS